MSNEYTPTTEDVQDIYGTHPTHVEEFYRWLAAHDAEVAAKTLIRAACDLRVGRGPIDPRRTDEWLEAQAAGIRGTR